MLKYSILSVRAMLVLSEQPKLETSSAIGIQQEAADQLFQNTESRPTPGVMASLICRGLTEDIIVASAASQAFHRPTMDLQLQDLEASLPAFQHISDVLAADYPDDVLLFAGRDAEVLYDDYSLTHPDTVSHLLPASSDLWRSPAMGKRNLGARFLGQFGLTESSVAAKENRYVLVDSGFQGTIGIQLNHKIKLFYQHSLLASGSLLIRLVAANRNSRGQEILGTPSGYGDIELARYNALYRGETNRHPGWIQGDTYPLAVGMQVMPRYHGPYYSLDEYNDSVIALAAYEQPLKNVDDVGWMNSSMVNPVAAAIIQYRVVKAAMQRAGRLGQTTLHGQ